MLKSRKYLHLSQNPYGFYFCYRFHIFQSKQNFPLLVFHTSFVLNENPFRVSHSPFCPIFLILTYDSLYPAHSVLFCSVLSFLRSISSNTAPNGGSIPHMDKLMFNKMRQKRLGAVDARSVRCFALYFYLSHHFLSNAISFFGALYIILYPIDSYV